MSDFRVDIQGLPAFRAKLQRFPQAVRSETVRAIQRSVLSGERLSKQLVKVWRGHARRSIASRVTQFAGGVRGEWGTAIAYGRVLEEGRRAGATPPPTAPIAAWLASKGADPRLAYVVARAIGRRGIPAQPFIYEAFRRLRGQIQREMAQIPGRALKAAGFR